MEIQDDLAVWLRVRAAVDWADCPETGPASAARDGVVEFIRSTAQTRGESRAQQLLSGLTAARGDSGPRPSYAMLERWQRLVLGLPNVPFRIGPAFAKGGRERYGLGPDTLSTFNACLVDAADPELPLPARAVRAYLDVCYFHPFPDGNGRAALLLLDHLLHREGVVLAQAGPLFVLSRRADDADGHRGFVRLLSVLIEATRRAGIVDGRDES